ncbi:concanavalin A-like lectin/glucanase domain-containing protein [Cyathus striatus]|nr:concanavalin A-like lectin/glucanase domain-containing protein [Cyathus striatus]
MRRSHVSRQEGRWWSPRATNDSSAKSGKSYTLNHQYRGADFLNQWDFFTAPDPTHGLVNYVSKEDAQSKGLAYVQDGAAILAVDDKTSLPPNTNRDSVRIQTQQTYNGGIFVADFSGMPFGCSVWPAYWSVGPNWPAGGEIDILEGVHNQAVNQMTLHTSDGCTLSSGGGEASGNVLNQQCASGPADNTGCAYQDHDDTSYGKAFNDIGGGVFAHQWDSSGIRVWHFPRTNIPDDIKNGEQQLFPESWGTPVAFFSSDSCSMSDHFYEHKLVIDTTLCGDWAGATYSSAGCPGTCGQRVSNPANFAG